jgi:UDP-N-acetylmuramoyl-tripeptide--D-alanyl-D-alanine ligase
MASLWKALPSNRRGGYAGDAAALVPQVMSALAAGDAIMVKGSLGSRMGSVVKALERAYSRNRALEDAAARG